MVRKRVWRYRQPPSSSLRKDTRGALHYRWSGISEFSLHLVYVHIFDFLQHRYFHHGGTLRPDIDLRDSCVCCYLPRVTTIPSSAPPVLVSSLTSDPLFFTYWYTPKLTRSKTFATRTKTTFCILFCTPPRYAGYALQPPRFGLHEISNLENGYRPVKIISTIFAIVPPLVV